MKGGKMTKTMIDHILIEYKVKTILIMDEFYKQSFIEFVENVPISKEIINAETKGAIVANTIKTYFS